MLMVADLPGGGLAHFGWGGLAQGTRAWLWFTTIDGTAIWQYCVRTTLGVTPPVGFLSLQVHGRCYGDRNSSFRNRPPCYIFANNFKWVQTSRRRLR